MNTVVVFFVWAVAMLISQRPETAIKAAIVTALPINIFDIAYCAVLWIGEDYMFGKYHANDIHPETSFFQYRQHIYIGSFLFILLSLGIVFLGIYHYKIIF